MVARAEGVVIALQLLPLEAGAEAIEGGHGQPGLAEGGEDAGLSVQIQRGRIRAGLEDAHEEDADEIDLAGGVAEGGGVKAGPFGGGEEALVDGRVRVRVRGHRVG